MEKKLMLLIFVGILIIGIVSSVGEFTYCCEKTKDNFWCQNEEDPNNCQTGGGLNEPVPTSCQATSYCKLGCCYNSKQGTCMPNTPETLCEQEEGLWYAESQCNIPQCNLGCCVMGDQAGFFTQVRCKKLSTIYGIDNDFRTDITNEIDCFALAGQDKKGACVYEQDFEVTCQILTKKECLAFGQGAENGASFHEGLLCTAPDLATNCAKTQKTTCVENKDEVYYLDSCGNIANIYDANKYGDDNDYWKYLYEKDDACNLGDDLQNAKTCGNCDYLSGSTCKEYNRNLGDISPEQGDYVCRGLGCEYEGKPYQHGETWCADNPGVQKVELINNQTIEVNGRSLPGGDYFRMICFNNEVTIEPCASFRQENCVETSVRDFKAAKCRANLWRDCIFQETQEDCENIEARDCVWILSGGGKVDNVRAGGGGDEELRVRKGILGGALVSWGFSELDISKNEYEHICVPAFTPGLKFWSDEETSGEGAEEVCATAERSCQVLFEGDIVEVIGSGNWDCKENCQCCINDVDGDGEDDYDGCEGYNIGNMWAEHETFCEALGDCGTKKNYIETKGWEYDKGLIFEG